MNTKQDYYLIGTREHPVISNSSLSYIDPTSGGSPQAFLAFFDDNTEEQQAKKYLRMGQLIHLWAEDPKNFKIAAVDKPSDKLGEVADVALAIMKNKAKTLLEDNEQYQTNWTITDEDYDDGILEACKIIRWNPKWGDDALKKNAVPLIKPYLIDVQVAENEHLIYVTAVEAECIAKCVAAVNKHPKAKELLFGQDNDFSNKKTYKELEVMWEKEIMPIDRDTPVILHFKAKLDDVTIDFDDKIVWLNDPKTTSSGAYSFSDTFVKYRYYRQIAFYKWAIKNWFEQEWKLDFADFTFVAHNIVIETNKLFQVVVHNVSDKWIKRGQKEFQALIRRLAAHTATKQWNYSLEEFNNDFVIDIPYIEVDGTKETKSIL